MNHQNKPFCRFLVEVNTLRFLSNLYGVNNINQTAVGLFIKRMVFICFCKLTPHLLMKILSCIPY